MNTIDLTGETRTRSSTRWNRLGCSVLFIAWLLSGCMAAVGPEEFEGAGEPLITGQTHTPLDERTVKLCFRLAPDFVSYTPDAPTRESYLARGIRFDLTDSGGVVTTFNANLNTGCKKVELESNESYRVRVYSEANAADGNTIRVMDDSLAQNVFRHTFENSLVINLSLGYLEQGSTVEYVWEADKYGSVEDRVPNALATAIYTLRQNAVTSDEEYRLYTTTTLAPCDEDDACFSATADALGPAVWANGGLSDRYVVSHELGHLALYLRMGEQIGDDGGHSLEYRLPHIPGITSPCANGASHTPGDDEYEFGSEESGNAAFAEGFAQYYSASVWNDSASTECFYRGLDCYEPGRAFDACYTDNRVDHVWWTGFERDWLTTLWAIERESGCGVSLESTVDIVVAADPQRWMNNHAKAELLLHAGTELTGAEYSCFLDTISDRIGF